MISKKKIKINEKYESENEKKKQQIAEKEGNARNQLKIVNRSVK